FGKIFSTVGTPRLIQFSLRYSFSSETIDGGCSAAALFRREVIRFPSGNYHETDCIAGFSAAWRRRAGGVFTRQGTGAPRAFHHSSGTRRTGFSSRGPGGGCVAQCRSRGARPLLLDARPTGSR